MAFVTLPICTPFGYIKKKYYICIELGLRMNYYFENITAVMLSKRTGRTSCLRSNSTCAFHFNTPSMPLNDAHLGGFFI